MKKIMIVDDSVIIRQRLREVFRSKGFDVVAEVDNGEKAIMKFMEHRPNVVTMDISLPGISGIETVKKLIDIDPDVKIIMITAMGERTTVMQAIKLGAVNFIVKPFQEDKVIEVIYEVLGISSDEEEPLIEETEDDKLKQESNDENSENTCEEVDEKKDETTID